MSGTMYFLLPQNLENLDPRKEAVVYGAAAKTR